MSNPKKHPNGLYYRFIDPNGEEYCLLISRRGEPLQLCTPEGKGWESGSFKTHEVTYSFEEDDRYSPSAPLLNSRSYGYYREIILGRVYCG